MNRNETDHRKDICAVIVSYDPGSILLDNIEALLPQVHRCILVDNGSHNDEIVKEAEERYGVEVIELGENKGIAFALNVGLEYCVKNEFPMFLSMDQDTVLEPDAVDHLAKALIEEGAVSAGINWDRSISKDKSVEYLITSGNLVLVEAAKSIDGFDASLFIDSVDFDFCLRLRDKGYKIVKVADAGARHNLGDETGSGRFRTHSAFRWYYISRNHFYIIKKHGSRHRLFCLKKRAAFLKEMIMLAMWDKERGAKFKALLQGYRDYKRFRGNMK